MKAQEDRNWERLGFEMNIYVYGTGCGAGELVDHTLAPERVAAFVDSDARSAEFLGKPIISPEELAQREYDLIVVTTRQAGAVAARCKEAGIDLRKLFFLKNHFLLSDRNQAYAAAAEALGEAFVEKIRHAERVIRTPCWSEREALPESELDNDYVRLKSLEAICRELGDVTGDAAELGVFRGAFARCINTLLPDRRLYLFDSFEGFAPPERAGYGEGFLEAHRDTAAARVLAALPHPEMAVLRAGFFPASAAGLEARFALVSLDVDLEESTLEGLRWFLPRMSPGGFLLLHDYNNPELPGVRAALRRYEAETGERLRSVPLCDVNGTLVVRV